MVIVFDNFPQELIEIITSFLSLNDILACCKVCKNWREIFNNDRIWFKLFKKKSQETFNKLRLIEDPSFVEPKFEFSNDKSGTLLPISKWRLKYMQETHVTKNWIQGRFVKYNLMYFSEGCYNHQNDDFDDFHVEYEGNFVVVPYYEKSKDSILSSENSSTSEYKDFNAVKGEFKKFGCSRGIYKTKKLNIFIITDEGLKLCHEIFYPFYYTRIFYKLINKWLVVVQNTLVEVYAMCSKTVSVNLHHSFLFDSSDLIHFKIPYKDKYDWYKNTVKSFPYFCADFNGKYFVGVAYNEFPIVNPKIHVWDIKRKVKIAVKDLSNLNLVQKIKLVIFDTFLLVIAQLLTSENCGIYQFKLDGESCLTLLFEIFIHQSYFYDELGHYLKLNHQFIVTLDRDFNTIVILTHGGEIYHKISSDFILNPKSLNLCYNNLLFVGDFKKDNKRSSVVNILNLTDLTLLKINFPDVRINNVYLVLHNIVLMSVKTLNASFVVVYNILTRHALKILPYDFIWQIPDCTKMLLVDPKGVDLVCFW